MNDYNVNLNELLDQIDNLIIAILELEQRIVRLERLFPNP